MSVVLTVHARRWSAEELARHLKRHREFFIGGPAGKEGILLEIVPDTLKKVDGDQRFWGRNQLTRIHPAIEIWNHDMEFMPPAPR